MKIFGVLYTHTPTFGAITFINLGAGLKLNVKLGLEGLLVVTYI